MEKVVRVVEIDSITGEDVYLLNNNNEYRYVFTFNFILFYE